ncbi:hypothetical protein HKBW3C_02711, partial [Candidatus Hakubella thermalkaliphila]
DGEVLEEDSKGIAHAPRRTTSHENYVIFKGEAPPVRKWLAERELNINW